ncbi:filamentous hemagglutinin N-terminal domain-containing protein [Nostoc sp. DedQUE09]|uniref:two-partner secretion domain-containing protein n=1 Tax=Nostoc sp. DedQUE09 TaxID=3075394 RepID=UPI002AD5A6B0|nr:filamentous hemagglutinin N-terminal domain-containing protein [Nostoc sp. DedQUE09]MDZ7949585.1 filamentous hemagglutinin N-terminal domain-containing protein [Nostoc sp. DedQUE09]
MSTCWVWFKSLGVIIGGATAFSANSAIAQITQDNTLPNNSQVTQQGNITIIQGGTRSGSNLFHSFKEFSVMKDSTADFQNVGDIQNIISRVTGKSISDIDGILKTNGPANLFLINPNGIIFGPNASLQVGGSFLASTASSLNFADGTKFSATDPQSTPLLTLSVPIGLQFGATANSIRNQSQAKVDGVKNLFEQPVGLQVQPGHTLALVGGDLVLEGGNLTAKSGRIDLGSVASNSLVSLNSINKGWVLGYENVQNFQNIKLIQRTDGFEIPSIVDASGEGGGNIQVQGRQVLLSSGSGMWTLTLGSQPGGNLTVTASESVELIDRDTALRTGTKAFAVGKAGDLTITTEKLIVQDGAQVGTSTISEGAGGNLNVNASKSLDVIGTSTDGISSALFSTTGAAGQAGDITITTSQLSIKDGATISTESSQRLENSQYIVATGKGGNLTVDALDSVEITGTSATGNPSGLFATTFGSGDAGNVTITTKQLIVGDGSEISVSSLGYTSNPGKTGELNIVARSILLDNQGKLTSDTKSGRGGNISLQVRDLLLMRRNSQITTNAKGDGDGGNIFINASNGFLVASTLGNSDITANAFSGSGGKITITAKNIFGFVQRTRTDIESLLNTKDPDQLKPSELATSDITAFSQQDPSLNGTVQINSPDADPSKGLVELPVNLVDVSQQIAASCSSGGKIARNSFITTGRGGLVADPTEPLIADDAVLADWIALPPESQNRAGGIQKIAVVQAQRNTEEKSQKVNSVNEPTQIVEAQGWIIDANGNVVLVAQVPTTTLHNSSLTAPSCPAH